MVGRGEITAVVTVSGGWEPRLARMGLRAPWGEPPGERALERVGRVLRGASGVGRCVVASRAPSAVRPLVGRWADLALAPSLEFEAVATAGLTVAVRLTRAPAAVLLWPMCAPLAGAEVLDDLLDDPRLGQPDERWATWPELERAPVGETWPVLLSRGLVEALIQGEGWRREALSGPGVAPRRVVSTDPAVALLVGSWEKARDVIEGASKS